MNFYAQIDRKTNCVDLVGTEEQGMPVPDNDIVYTIDITNHPQRDDIQQTMTYDPATDTFAFVQKEPIPPQPTELEILNAKIDYIAMLVEPEVV